MNDVINIIRDYLPFIPQFVLWCLIVLYLILQLREDGDKVKKYISVCKSRLNLAENFYWSKKRKKYDQVLSSPEFLKWQKNILDKIYSPLINQINLRFDGRKVIDFTRLTIEDQTNEYESITLRLPKRDYPFEGVCPKYELDTSVVEVSKTGDRHIIDEESKKVNRYYNIIKNTIKYPKRMGYMLKQIVIDDYNNWYVKSYCGDYESNLKTSHILEYELQTTFHKNRDIINSDRNEILKELKIRKSIHDIFEHEEDVLLSGDGRLSLLGVQMLVLVKNRSGSYDALRIRRSAKVSAKSGFLQFVPSGGFEAMNDCVDFDSQWDNYSLQKAIFRELLEECFGQDEDDKKASGNNVSPDRIYHNTYIKKLLEMLKYGEAEMQLLGTSMNLVSLRHEFSFILKIEDVDFAEMLIGNYESETAVHLVDIRNLEQYKFWNHSGEYNELEILNCTSAGLFELARESEIYQRALGNRVDNLP